jgi:nitrogen fixation NifU-like protein
MFWGDACPATMEVMYSPRLLDHFQNPRNAGDLADADVVSEIENPVCGDVLRMSLKLQAGRITQIGFKAKGCVPAIACGSALTEMALGKSVAEIHKIGRADLIAAVGGLPQASTHAAQLALDVLSSALRQAEVPPVPDKR